MFNWHLNNHRKLKTSKRASALILTIFIMAGMLLAAIGGAYVSVLGIKAGGIQADSTKAYYAAEAGSEYLLWRLTGIDPESYEADPPLITSEDSGSNLTYNVFFIDNDYNLIFRSIGEAEKTNRSTETRFGKNLNTP